MNLYIKFNNSSYIKFKILRFFLKNTEYNILKNMCICINKYINFFTNFSINL